MQQASPSPTPDPDADRGAGGLPPAIDLTIVAVFLGLVLWFLYGPQLAGVPGTPMADITPGDVSTAAVRQIQPARPRLRVAGFELNCNECHGLFQSAEEAAPSRTQHEHIVLDHGLNDRCFNCHDRLDRDRLALRGGRTVPFTGVARLCAKCHGPTYRDWQKGMHGRTMGHWDATLGQRRLRCSECHDPHAPAFAPLPPLPGPHTLRMGAPPGEHHDEAVDRIDPLRKWRRAETAAADLPTPEETP